MPLGKLFFDYHNARHLSLSLSHGERITKSDQECSEIREQLICCTFSSDGKVLLR